MADEWPDEEPETTLEDVSHRDVGGLALVHTVSVTSTLSLG